MTLGADGFHGLSRQFGGQSELTLFFIPESIAHRDRKIEDFPILVYRKGEQETDHTVSTEGIINRKKNRLFCQSAWNSMEITWL